MRLGIDSLDRPAVSLAGVFLDEPGIITSLVGPAIDATTGLWNESHEIEVVNLELVLGDGVLLITYLIILAARIVRITRGLR